MMERTINFDWSVNHVFFSRLFNADNEEKLALTKEQKQIEKKMKRFKNIRSRVLRYRMEEWFESEKGGNGWRRVKSI